MKRSSSLFLTWTLGLAAIASLAGVALAQDAKQNPQPASVQAALVAPADEADSKAGRAKTTPVLGEITIEDVAAQRVLIRQIQGGYDKHQEVFSDLKNTVTQLSAASTRQGAPGVKLAAAADCVALYGLDPDTVTADRLTWSAALYVPDSFSLPSTTKAKALSVPASEYKVETLPAIKAAVTYSTIGRAPTDGLKFFAWMADNGYVQVGPTRMVYFTDPQFDLLRATPEQIKNSPTKIVVPIQRRDRAIALKKEKAQE